MLLLLVIYRLPPAAQLWRHTVPDGILHKNLKFRQFSYTAALFTVTASDGTDRTRNKMYSAAAFHCTDRQCAVDSTVDTVWCWCYWLNGCCSLYGNTSGCVWTDCLLCSEQLTDCMQRSSSWEDDVTSTHQGIPLILQTQMFITVLTTAHQLTTQLDQSSLFPHFILFLENQF